MPVVNAYTKIAARRTLDEIEQLLVTKGARNITKRYENGQAIGIAFSLQTPFGEQTFVLPVDVAAMQKLLVRDYSCGLLDRRHTSLEHARDVAWRNILSWIKAQLVMVELGQVTLDQIMLPYLVDRTGQTLYHVLASGQLALPAPTEVRHG